MGSTRPKRSVERAEAIFRMHGGLLRISEAIRYGIHPRTIYTMCETGRLERVNRGLYQLVAFSPYGELELAYVGKVVPGGVLCLISALAHHEITTQIPHEVQIALEFGSRAPKIDYPTVHYFRFKGPAFHYGIERNKIAGTNLRVYTPEKTLADCFKYRNRIGLDIAIEALKLYRDRRSTDINKIVKYAKICRVERIMRPYLESLFQ
jgi:predicted transcriptional regulator of viral defense system